MILSLWSGQLVFETWTNQCFAVDTGFSRRQLDIFSTVCPSRPNPMDCYYKSLSHINTSLHWRTADEGESGNSRPQAESSRLGSSWVDGRRLMQPKPCATRANVVLEMAVTCPHFHFVYHCAAPTLRSRGGTFCPLHVWNVTPRPNMAYPSCI